MNTYFENKSHVCPTAQVPAGSGNAMATVGCCLLLAGHKTWCLKKKDRRGFRFGFRFGGQLRDAGRRIECEAHSKCSFRHIVTPCSQEQCLEQAVQPSPPTLCCFCRSPGCWHLRASVATSKRQELITGPASEGSQMVPHVGTAWHNASCGMIVS